MHISTLINIELFGKFRFRRQDILDLTDELQQLIELPNRKGVLPPVLQVLLTLRFYACGSFQDVCGELIGEHDYTRDGGTVCILVMLMTGL